MGFLSKFTGSNTVTLVKQSGPAVQRSSVESAAGGVNLVKQFDKAGIALNKELDKIGLDGIRAEAFLILDHSYSMSNWYENGLVQKLVDRALGFALQIDADGKIPVLPFDSKLHKTVEVSLQNYQGIVNSKIYKPRDMGGTTLGPALAEIKKEALKTKSPIFLIIITDDSPGDRTQVNQLLADLAGLPVFVKVLSLVTTPYWDGLDDLKEPGRVDNIDAKKILDIDTINDLKFAEAMVDEWSSWITEAQSAGILV